MPDASFLRRNICWTAPTAAALVLISADILTATMWTRSISGLDPDRAPWLLLAAIWLVCLTKLISLGGLLAFLLLFERIPAVGGTPPPSPKCGANILPFEKWPERSARKKSANRQAA